MIGPLNHVGIAVPSIKDAVDTYKNLYGVTDISEPGEMIEQGVRYCFVNLPNSQIELIEPLGDNSPINNFLEKNPKGGQHHVCFEVDDIYKAISELKEKNIDIINDNPSVGAEGYKIIFIHPKSTGGVLVELAEKP